MALTQSQIDQFHLNGFLIVEDVLSSDEVDALAEHTDRIATRTLDHIPETSIQLEQPFRERDRPVVDQVLSVRKLYNLAVYDDTMWSHVTNPKIVRIISDLLGTEDVKLYGDQLFMKAPSTGSEIPWHQDSAAWRDILPMDLVTAWTALDDATIENSCLHFIPGTHRWGMQTNPKLEPLKPDLGSERWPAVPAELSRGSISFHHSLILHRSSQNTSGKRRRGYACHYMRASSYKDETITDAPKMPPFKQVRGRSFEGRV